MSQGKKQKKALQEKMDAECKDARVAAQLRYEEQQKLSRERSERNRQLQADEKIAKDIAEKLKFLPPLVTLVTLLIATNLSFNSVSVDLTFFAFVFAISLIISNLEF